MSEGETTGTKRVLEIRLPGEVYRVTVEAFSDRRLIGEQVPRWEPEELYYGETEKVLVEALRQLPAVYREAEQLEELESRFRKLMRFAK